MRYLSNTYRAKRDAVLEQMTATEPVYIRLPRAGQYEPRTSLTRSKLNSLILGDNPPVRSISVTPPGKNRGCRLIDYKSLLAYLSLF